MNIQINITNKENLLPDDFVVNIMLTEKTVDNFAVEKQHTKRKCTVQTSTLGVAAVVDRYRLPAVTNRSHRIAFTAESNKIGQKFVSVCFAKQRNADSA